MQTIFTLKKNPFLQVDLFTLKHNNIVAYLKSFL